MLKQGGESLIHEDGKLKIILRNLKCINQNINIRNTGDDLYETYNVNLNIAIPLIGNNKCVEEKDYTWW